MASKEYLNALIDTRIPQGNGTTFAKYHTIKNTQEKLQKFERFALGKFPQAWFVNYYWKHLPEGDNFAFRRYLQ
jgi:hypothetical protein